MAKPLENFHRKIPLVDIAVGPWKHTPVDNLHQIIGKEMYGGREHEREKVPNKYSFAQPITRGRPCASTKIKVSPTCGSIPGFSRMSTIFWGTDGPSLDKWRKESERKHPQILRMNADDLLPAKAEIAPADYSLRAWERGLKFEKSRILLKQNRPAIVIFADGFVFVLQREGKRCGDFS